MKKIKVSEASGAVLDWLVAKCEGVAVKKYKESPNLFFGGGFDKYKPSTNWAQGGPIIEREQIETYFQPTLEQWAAKHDGNVLRYGPTPLIAAMRCYVASKLGDTVEIPEELIG